MKGYSIYRNLCFLCAAWLGVGNLFSETRLLTGDGLGELHSGGGTLMDLSDDGDLVLFTALVPSGSSVPGLPKSGLYLREISTQDLEFVGDETVANPGIRAAEMSDDGKYLAWSSTSQQIYWRDRDTGTTRLVTKGISGNYSSPRMSADGRYVAFASTARTLVADTSKLPGNNRAAVYLYDSQLATIALVSLSSTGGALSGVGSSTSALESFDLSADGKFVVYSSEDANAHPDRGANMSAGFLAVYRRELSTGTVLLLNRNSSGAVADGNYILPRINANGSRVAFMGKVTGYPGRTAMISTFPQNPSYDTYVKEPASGMVWGVTKSYDGTAHSGAESDGLVIDDAGSTVVFSSFSNKLLAGDDPGGTIPVSDIFKAALSPVGTVQLTQVTRPDSGSANINHTTMPLITGDGGYIAFGTQQFSALEITGTSALSHGVARGEFPGPPSSGVPFFIWAFSLPFGQQGANDNPSGDGVANLVKYYVGSDGRVPDQRFLPVKGLAKGSALGLTGDNRDYLTLSVRIRRDRPAGYTWSVQTAGNLTDLVSNPVAAVQVGVAVPEDVAFDRYLFRFPTPVSGKGFMRLKVNLP